jgi:hypothetical protein
VILLIYEAIGVIKRQKPQKWLHDELKQLNEIFFRFQVLQLIINASMHEQPKREALQLNPPLSPKGCP